MENEMLYAVADCQNYSLFKIVRFNKRNQFKLSIGLKKLK